MKPALAPVIDISRRVKYSIVSAAKAARVRRPVTFGLGPEDYPQAEWLANAFEGRWRYDHSAGQHGRWHGFSEPGIWFPDKVKRINIETATIAAEGILHAQSETLRKALLRLRMLAAISRALEALSSFPEYSTDGSDWDQEPNLLGVGNGLVDLTTGKLRPGEPDDLVTRSTGINYVPDAKCPDTLKFLNDIFADHNGDPQPELRRYILTVLGAALFGHTNPQQFWLFLGPGGAGKGTLARLVAHVLGGEEQYAVFPAPTLYTESRFPPGSDRARADLIDLKGKRLAYISEPVSPFDDLTLFNHSGGDNITARTLFSSVQLTWTPTHTIIFSANRPPAIKEVGVNMRRRLRVVPFVRTFGDKPDTELRTKLEAESEGFLALLIRYAVKYHQDPHMLDFDRAPKVVQEASKAFIEANDPLAGFVRDHVIFEQGAKTSSEKLYEAYAQWHARSGRDDELLTQVKFAQAMHDAYQHQYRKDRDKNPSKTMTYFGVGLLVKGDE
jgi:putative DNA primase/helicase